MTALSTDPSKRVIALIQEQLLSSQTCEIQLWDQMTREVCALIEKISSVTAAKLSQNAALVKEIALASESREREREASKALIRGLITKVTSLEKEMQAIETKISAIERMLIPEEGRARVPCDTYRYLEAIEKVRQYYLVHEHCLIVSGNKGCQNIKLSPPK